MGRKKQNSPLSNPQEGKPLVDSFDKGDDKVQKEVTNVIVLRAFDLGVVHYSPLRKYYIEEEFIPELLETRKIKLNCKHG